MRHTSRAFATGLIAIVAALTSTAGAAAAIAPRGSTSAIAYASNDTKALRITVPTGTQPGDVLLATLGFGDSGAKAQPTLTAPTGWTLVSRANQGNIGALAIYRHTFASGESSYTWTSSASEGGVVFLTAFSGVDATNPVDTSASRTGQSGTSIVAPSVTTAAAGEALVAGYYGYVDNGSGTTWNAPASMTRLATLANTTGSRSGGLAWSVQGGAGSSGDKTAVTSAAQTYAVGTLVALRPDGSSSTPPSPTPPVISGVTNQSATTSGATITWATDQPADSQVDYGTTTAYGTSTPLDAALVTNHSVSLSGLSASTIYHYRVKSRNAAGQLTTSPDFTVTTAAAPPPSGATPLIVDTDIFSDADDVGALAVAFGLQLKNEAKVIAINVNTRTSRPSVATTSWKCVAAIAQFYGSGSIPIGSDMPDNGTARNVTDFAGPCSLLAAPGTPSPAPAVTVYRQALAAQADGSVVIASTGYLENLSALLNSSPDAISPLSGRDLVARKVRSLVIMGGGYPKASTETNLAGNVAAAQNVAANWPTKIAWSGYEVGDAVHTGQTISSVHPSNSPVRVAYEAFVGRNNWIYSYDLTAVYHAIRPADALLTEVGPGRNTINSSGGNTFTTGSGNQYYLRLTNATNLDASIEALLDVLPGASTPPPSGGGGGTVAGDPLDLFDNNVLDPGRWTVTASTSKVAAANQELEITHSAGSWTKGGVQWSQPYDLTGKATAIQLKRAANDGKGGSTYGETSILLTADATHYAEFFVAGGSLTAWVAKGSGETNLTTSWPAYSATNMQWLRFRESGGTLYWEYASGTTAPGAWTVLASARAPFALTAVRYSVVAGTNLNTTDVARFDNVGTATTGATARAASLRRAPAAKAVTKARKRARAKQRCAVARRHLVRKSGRAGHRRNHTPPRGSRGRRRLLSACRST